MKRRDIHNDADLLRSVAGGDPIAFAQLMDRYQDQVYALALKILKSSEMAQEIVQDVFLKIWLQREKMVQVENPGGYLHNMTRNYVMTQLAKIAREHKAARELDYDDVYVTEDTREICYEDVLKDAIEKLPAKQQQVFKMAKLEQMSYEDIARAMGISVFTVKNHMIKALQSVRLTAAGHRAALLAIALLVLEG